MQITLTIPIPPLSSQMWRRLGGSPCHSPEYKKFINAVVSAWTTNSPDNWPSDQRYSVNITLFPAVNRRHNASSRIKPTLDALKRAGAWNELDFVESVCISKGEPIKDGPKATVTLTLSKKSST